ncbi:MAG: alpha/beta hydrolase [Acidimicrobiales bacterium]
MTDRAYDPELAEVVALMPTVVDWPDPSGMPAMREAGGLLVPDVAARPDVRREDRKIPGRPGDPDVAVRIYRPTAAVDGLLPAVVEIHGGGFVTGSLEMMDAFCDAVAAELPSVVVSVDYRLAPEHPFPAGVDDCYAALVWLAEHAAELGVDADRIAISGQSAGGGLAAGTALMARDRGGPALCFQLLDIPELDDRLDTPSMEAFVDTPLWNRPNAVRSWSWYLGSDDLPGSDDVSIYAAPARADDLAGLPPTFVSVCGFDPLGDEGLVYAMRSSGRADRSSTPTPAPSTARASCAAAGASGRHARQLRRAAAAPSADPPMGRQTRARASASSEPS